jgi:hypothetical protein
LIDQVSFLSKYIKLNEELLLVLINKFVISFNKLNLSDVSNVHLCLEQSKKSNQIKNPYIQEVFDFGLNLTRLNCQARYNGFVNLTRI